MASLSPVAGSFCPPREWVPQPLGGAVDAGGCVPAVLCLWSGASPPRTPDCALAASPKPVCGAEGVRAGQLQSQLLENWSILSKRLVGVTRVPRQQCQGQTLHPPRADHCCQFGAESPEGLWCPPS